MKGFLDRITNELAYLKARGLTRPDELKSTPKEWPGQVWNAYHGEYDGFPDGYYISLRTNSAIPVAFYKFKNEEPTSPEYRALNRHRGLGVAIAIAKDFDAIDGVGPDEIEDLRTYGRVGSRNETPDWLYEYSISEFGDGDIGVAELRPYCPKRFADLAFAAMTLGGTSAFIKDENGNQIQLDISDGHAKVLKPKSKKQVAA